MTPWIDRPEHHRFLSAEFRRLLDFGRPVARAGGGASWLNGDGSTDDTTPLEPYLTARGAFAHSLGSLAGVPGCKPVAQRVFDGLRGPLHDDEHGGWFHAVAVDGTRDESKACYDHAHTLLAASTAVIAGLDGAHDVFDEASALMAGTFFDDDLGLVRDGFDRTFSTPDAYLGANANMHSVEAMLAAADASGDAEWLRRAERIAHFFLAQASAHDGRLPEHFTPDAEPLLDYNRDEPEHPFKPFGATVGHGLEWTRLLLQLEAALGDAATGSTASGLSLLDGARLLFDRAVADGWAADGRPGFVYTTDFAGVPVTTQRLWWVLAEATGAAAALWRRTGEDRYAALYEQWWDHLADRFLDRERGSWHHCLTPDGVPDQSIWAGKPDLYHTVQATLLSRLPLAPGTASALRDGLLP